MQYNFFIFRINTYIIIYLACKKNQIYKGKKNIVSEGKVKREYLWAMISPTSKFFYIYI